MVNVVEYVENTYIDNEEVYGNTWFEEDIKCMSSIKKKKGKVSI